MAAQTLDFRRIELALKAAEGMLAYAGFDLAVPEAGGPCAGVLKVSVFHREDGSGYLTLTFLVDVQGDFRTKNSVERLFAGLTEERLAPLLGGRLRMFVRVPLDSDQLLDQWLIEELNMYFQTLAGHEGRLLELYVLPAMSSLLGCTFDKLEWWNNCGQLRDDSQGSGWLRNMIKLLLRAR